MTTHPITYLIVDGENLDGVLSEILGHKPAPTDRPRWQQVLEFATTVWGTPTRGLFFVNASRQVPYPFVQALIAIGYRPVLLTGSETEKVVDTGILRTLDAINERPGNVLLASHDGDFADKLALLADGTRRVGVLGFEEYLSQSYRQSPNIERYDLEISAQAFEYDLPRVRVIPIDQFDPNVFL